MATSTLCKREKLQSTGRTKSRAARKNQGVETLAEGDALMKQILKDLQSMPQGQILKRIASLSEIRRGKVLNICCQITQGTYEETGRLERVIDRVLEVVTA